MSSMNFKNQAPSNLKTQGQKFKVRIREEIDELSSPNDDRTLMKAIDGPQARCRRSPEKQKRNHSPSSVALIAKPHVLDTTADPVSVSKCNGKNNKEHVKAVSVSRPRAVLSSPDNDHIIGKRNKSTIERCSARKDRGYELKILVRPKVPTTTLSEADNSSRKGFKINPIALKQNGLSSKLEIQK